MKKVTVAVAVKSTNNLVDFSRALVAQKSFTGQDGAVVGKDSVSGSDYFDNMPNVGTIFQNKDGKMKVIVDAIAYPAHKSESGKVYKDEVRFVALTFDNDTLDFTGERTNVGFDHLAKNCKVVHVRCYEWLYDRSNAKLQQLVKRQTAFNAFK